MPELATAPWRDIHFTSFDDLRLYARHYPAEGAGIRSVLCLPGLTRNSKDFHVLASYLATHEQRPRNVYCLDFRGRGASQFDRHWHNYTPLIELRDTLDFMALTGLHKAAIVGTSRGGIVAMMMGALRPAALGAVVLNDVGPVLETRGLARITGYVGRVPVPKTWEDAALLTREMNERAFPAIAPSEWGEIARNLYNEKKGRPALGYDPRIARAFRGAAVAPPNLWPQFTALQQFPALVLRGANSDLLSAETVAEMVDRHPNLRTSTVQGQGHAPFLRDWESVEAIELFLAAND